MTWYAAFLRGAGLLLLCAAAIVGCRPAEHDAKEANARAGKSPDAAGGAAETKRPQEISVQPIDGPGFQEVLQRHRGKVLLVDFWATWCGPCVEGFPHVVDLHRRLGRRGLAVVAVSMDEPEHQARVEKFLAKQGAAFENFLSRYGVGTEAAEAFGVGPLPHYNLYDRQGKLVKSFVATDGPIDAREIDRAIEALLE